MTVSAPEVLARADGLDLIGEMKGSGYREPPALVRRADGQTVQLTPLLYVVLSEIREDRTADAVAEAVTARLGRTVTADNVTHLVAEQLRPLGLLKRADGSDPELKRANPLLGLRMKFAITDTRRTRQLTAPFAMLFNPLLILLISAGFIAVAWWVLFRKGLASATYEAFAHPGLLLVVVAVMLLSAGFHEFGHAAAARRGGAEPGAMGAGLYLVWPAFYTDVTDSYRLGRAGRIRTDLGGLYFDAMVTVGVFGVWAATRWDGWLLVVAAQTLGMVRQLTPLVRFDGYHILCDLTGVPDLFMRIKPILLSFLPKYWKSPEVHALKPWVRVIASAWVLIVIPVLAFALLALLYGLPRIAGTAWARARGHAAVLADSAGAGEFLEAAGRVVAIFAVGLPVLAMSLMLFRVVWGLGKASWVRTRGKPAKRALAVTAGVLAVGLVALLWWPQPGRYRPVQPWERGTLADAGPRAALNVTGPNAAGPLGGAQVSYPKGARLPTQERPQLAMVLVPTDAGADATRVAGTPPKAGQPEAADPQTWVFPFDRPLAPEEGDNQALAVNTTDGGTTYKVAFAMVWVDDGADARNRNEAYALASCQDCTTVAVAFQVVFVVGQSDIIIPKNTAAAVNYNCRSCVTVALAQQMLLTVKAMPSEATMAQIQALWEDLMAFSEDIESKSFSEIQQALDDFEVKVMGALEKDGVLDLPKRSASPSPSPGSSTSPTPSPTGPSGRPTASSTGGSTSSPTPTPSPTRSGGSSPSPSSGTPSARSSASPSASSASAASRTAPPPAARSAEVTSAGASPSS